MIGRFTNDEKSGFMVVLKDKNWTSKGKRLHFGPLKKKMLLDQLEKDVGVSLF